MSFSYDINNRLTSVTAPDGSIYYYNYDESSSILIEGNEAQGILTSVTYPGGKKRIYWYNEQEKTNNTNLPFYLTGITDENGKRFATFEYDNNGLAIATEHAGGAGKYTVSYDPNYIKNSVLDPRGTERSHTLKLIEGMVKTAGQSQPGGAGCGPSASEIVFDANGNVASRTDFNGNKTTYVYDLARNLETVRVEAIGAAQARTITTEWHPAYRLPTRSAEPKKITTNTYDAQGNLLKKVEQATGDANGSQGFSATATGTPRTWTYTYNDAGQVLTATGPLGDVTANSYDSQGNLVSITNAAGHVTTFSNYDPSGRIGRIVDPNGLMTDLSYSPRGWLTSKTTGSETTNYDYDGVGQLTKVTLPDGSVIDYTYDDAHRLIAIADSAGNRIDYTLDPMGNRIKEQIKDPNGTLTRQTTRAYDALNRLQQVTGGMQ